MLGLQKMSDPIQLKQFDLMAYNKYLVMFSGGKDSLACLLNLLDQGVPKEKIELWHHDVDGQEGSTLMDWPVTRSYCKAVAKAFGIPIYFSWKSGGFEGEMLREDSPTAVTYFETPTGLKSSGGKGPKNTRLKFPQVSANLSVRWCSAYLKIGVASAAICGQDRFNNSRTLVITGERAQESTARSKYLKFEPHKTDRRKGKLARHVDHWRPVHSWHEFAVWELIKLFRVNPHPAYKLGWGRLSCMACIFGSANQWASVKAIAPRMFNKISSYEKQFNVTIQRKHDIETLAAKGEVYQMCEKQISIALNTEYTDNVFVNRWELPAGAFGESVGPV